MTEESTPSKDQRAARVCVSACVSVCVSVCVSLLCASACLSAWGLLRTGIRLRLCVARLRVFALHVCVCVAVWEGSCVRCELLAVRAHRPPRAPNQRSTLGTRASRNFDFFEVRGERGRRVCRTSCVCVCGLMLSSVYFAYFAYFACRPNSVAERGTHTQR